MKFGITHDRISIHKYIFNESNFKYKYFINKKLKLSGNKLVKLVKLVFIYFLASVSLLTNCHHLKLTSNAKSTNKYFIKEGGKSTDSNEYGVPLEPLLAYDIYPGIERHTLELKYNEFMPGADLAQIEIGIKAMPGNIPITSKIPDLLGAKANGVKTEENQEWRYNRN